jgi:two-component SAPR family response regulator
MTKEQIGQELWHEIEDAQVLKTRFKQDIYRLRKAVGRGTIMFEDEYYRFNRDMDYEYDVEAFESYLHRARHVDDKMERIGYYRKAINLYEGRYLSDVDDDWVLIERERLRVIYISALEDLVRLYLDTNQLLECLGVCKLAIAQDRYNETIYQLEMRAYAAQGDRASVARRYREYKTILADDLGLAPSEETESVYRELTV